MSMFGYNIICSYHLINLSISIIASNIEHVIFFIQYLIFINNVHYFTIDHVNSFYSYIFVMKLWSLCLNTGNKLVVVNQNNVCWLMLVLKFNCCMILFDLCLSINSCCIIFEWWVSIMGYFLLINLLILLTAMIRFLI